MRYLVVGYGNPSRHDDGVGWFVVNRLKGERIAGADFVTVHQLEIDLVDSILSYDAVVFIDAAVDAEPGRVSLREVVPKIGLHPVSHFMTPEDIFGFCLALHGRVPKGVLISIGGCNFDFGEGLSEDVLRTAELVVAHLREKLSQGGNTLDLEFG